MDNLRRASIHIGVFSVNVPKQIGRKLPENICILHCPIKKFSRFQVILYPPFDKKRFNFSFQGKKEGLVYFPRYDEKTGKDILEGVKNVTLELSGTISPALTRGNATRFMWDVANDDPSRLYQGRTAAKIETDRLIKRLENLRKDKAEEDARLKAIEDEINTIQSRLDEISKNL